jgi:cytoskeletal protein CcmA (bactofilin family)
MFRLATLLFCLALPAGAAASALDSVRIGGNIEVSEPVADSLTAMGGRIYVNAPVDGDLRAAGGRIEVDSNAAIAGSASLAGGAILVNGSVDGDLHAAGGQITINGPVAGDASVAGGSLTLGPSANIAGNLRFHGGQLTRDPGAQVTGGTTFRPRRAHRPELPASERFAQGWFWTAGLVVLAALLAGALPGPSQRFTQELRDRPWLTPLVGFLALTAIPLAAAVMAITIIGIPMALLTAVLYAVLLLVGYVWLAVVLGGLLLDRFKPQTAALAAWRVGAAALTMIAIGVMVRVPFVGGLVKFAALVVGVGMIVGVLLRRAEAPAATA